MWPRLMWPGAIRPGASRPGSDRAGADRHRAINTRWHRDHGQATVELALAMPVLCLLLLGVVQFAVVIRDQLVVINAARAGARAAVVSADPAGAAAVAAGNAVGSGLPPAATRTSVSGQYVTVRVSMSSTTDVPLIGLLLPDIEVESSATMILEPP